MEIAAVIAVLVVLIGVPVAAVNRDLLFRRHSGKRAPAEQPLPFLIIPTFLGNSDLHTARTPTAPRTTPEAQFAPPDSEPAVESEIEDESDSATEPLAEQNPEVPLAPFRPHRSGYLIDAEILAAAEESKLADEPEDEVDVVAYADPDRSEDLSEDATIIFSRPVDEPMQILPGRLRILSGEPAREDMRLFSRLGEPPRIVVGRDSGPPHRHITLQSPTVSRRHAQMEFADGTWTITNLSQTNPVLVNDRVLTNGGSARKLADGDRIELGEVALRFLSS